ncbi:uncharacterized protein LOC107047007, partial [Diachasma alloeum]|uniref:uncharacterized protein LOC107043742 n=1 Tax=Diachasma alloeum TaxID=454923 RepID=UPI0007382676
SIAVGFGYYRGAKAILYQAILLRLLQLAPGLKDVELIISDFEKAALKAFRLVFPRARIQGCWFHFIKAMSGDWKKLSLQNAPSEPKLIAHSLALLPPHLIPLGVQIVKDVCALYNGIFPKLNVWSNYIQNEWGGKPEVVSVFGSCIRTNNDSEAFNRHFTARAGDRHPRVYAFIRNLQDVIQNEVINLQHLEGNIPVVKVKNLEEMFNKNMNIIKAQQSLSSTRPSPQGVYNFMKQLLPPQLSKIIDEERLKLSQGNVTKTTFMKKSKKRTAVKSSVEEEEEEEYGCKAFLFLSSKYQKIR